MNQCKSYKGCVGAYMISSQQSTVATIEFAKSGNHECAKVGGAHGC